MSLDPYLLVVIGPNGSGKSSIIANIINELPELHPIQNIRMVNADIAESAIAEISSIGNPIERSIEAQKWCARERKLLRGLRKSFAYETVGSHPVAGETHFEFMQEARDRGYYVEMLFVSTEDPEINIRRVGKRVAQGGHGVNKEKIVERYMRTMSFLPDYIESSDAALVVDNSIEDAPFRPLLRFSNGMTERLSDADRVSWLNKYLHA